MRGSPLLRAAAALAILLLAAIPVWKLTHQAAASLQISEPAGPAAESSATIELTFAHPPEDFQVLHLGKVVWDGRQPGLTMQKNFDLHFPADGIDLEIKANWLPGTPLTAVRVKVTHGYGSIEQSAWGKGSVDAVLTFKDPQ
jgi:hypothetical protein